MGALRIQSIMSNELSKRPLFVRPPEPPAEYLTLDPSNSIYVGKTKIFHVPFNWSYQYLTNPHICIVGITGAGKSISSDEKVLVRVGKEDKLVKIGALVDSIIKKHGAEEIDGCTCVRNPGVEVYAFGSNLKAKWSRVITAARKEAPQYLYRFTTGSGREVKTTGDHNIVVFREGCIKVVRGTEARVGDFVPTPRSISSESNLSELNLIELLGETKLHVTGLDSIRFNWKKFESNLPVDPRYDKYIRFYKRGRAIPIKYFKKLIEHSPLGMDEMRKLKIRAANGRISIPAILPITAELAKLLGFITAEGNMARDFIHISNCDEGFLTEVEACAKHLGSSSFRVEKGVRIASEPLIQLMKSFLLDKKSGEKSVPSFIFSCSKSIMAEYLKAYFEGDGSVEHHAVCATTKSKELANDLLYLLLRFGVNARAHPHWKRATNSDNGGAYYYRITISSKDNLDKFAEIGFLSQTKRERFTRLLAKTKEHHTNVDLIPEIGTVVKNLVRKGIVKRTQMTYSIVNNLRTPSRNYVGNMLDEIKSLGEERAWQPQQVSTFNIPPEEYEPTIEDNIEFLKLLANSDIMWDRIASVEKIDSSSQHVYDLEVEEEVFLAGFGGIFVHNSYFVKTFLSRAAFVWGSNAIIIDWAGEYRAWVKQTGGRIISLGKGDFINLMDLGGMKPLDRVKQIIRTLEILTDISQYPEQKRLTEQALEETYTESGFQLNETDHKGSDGKPLRPPTLKEVVKILEDKLKSGAYEFPAELENAIYRLKNFCRPGEDYFAQQSTVKLEELTEVGLVDVDMSGLPDEIMRGLAGLFVLQFLKEKMRTTGWSATKGLRVLVVLDEAWKIAKDERSDAIMIVREGRKYNFGLIVASQNPTDVHEAIFSNVGTTFILRVKFQNFLDYIQGSLNFSDYMRTEISKFGVGQCAVNMAFQTSTKFPETFLLEKIHGEEPLEEYSLDVQTVLTQAQLADENIPQSYAFEKNELKNKLTEFGMDDIRASELINMFNRNEKRMDIISFVEFLEKNDLARGNITSFLKAIGMEDSMIIDILNKIGVG
jgi:intein/homing endonuclease